MDYLLRIDQFRKLLVEKRLDAILLSNYQTIVFLTGYTNFSKEEREAYLLVTADNQYIFTDGRYTGAIKDKVSHFNLQEISHKNPLSNILKSLSKINKLEKIAIEEHDLKVSEWRVFSKVFKKLTDFGQNNIRSIKDDYEIENIRESCRIGDKLFDFILKKIKSGITEKQIKSQMEQFLKSKNVQISFEPVVAFGKNSSIPHHQTGDDKLQTKDGSFVLLDFGVKYNNYCSDITRTIFFGNPSKKQRDIYKVVADAQQKAADYISGQLKKGAKINAKIVDKVARDFIISKGYPSIPHSLGHGIGLQVHETPYLSVKSKQILESGMVFSIEPGIYIPGFGGVRIEDLYLIKEDKLLQLTSAPKELISI